MYQQNSQTQVTIGMFWPSREPCNFKKRHVWQPIRPEWASLRSCKIRSDPGLAEQLKLVVSPQPSLARRMHHSRHWPTHHPQVQTMYPLIQPTKHLHRKHCMHNTTNQTLFFLGASTQPIFSHLGESTKFDSSNQTHPQGPLKHIVGIYDLAPPIYSFSCISFTSIFL